MGRGLVRDDVNVVMFDEPLTVIDPHLKWKLRSKLKELHQRVRATMIYVTHDQTEALTFADQVVVMQDGEIVQIGTPVELFERPAHTFVGHFIGSPGMNVLALRCSAMDGGAFLEGHPIALEGRDVVGQGVKREMGVRPEFVALGDGAARQQCANGIRCRAAFGRRGDGGRCLGQGRDRRRRTAPRRSECILQFRPDQTPSTATAGWRVGRLRS